MEKNEYEEINRRELVEIATQTLEGSINPILGIRKICTLRFAISDPNNVIFLPARGIDSETDHFPIGKERDNWDFNALERFDKELEKYLMIADVDIKNICKEILFFLKA